MAEYFKISPVSKNLMPLWTDTEATVKATEAALFFIMNPSVNSRKAADRAVNAARKEQIKLRQEEER